MADRDADVLLFQAPFPSTAKEISYFAILLAAASSSIHSGLAKSKDVGDERLTDLILENSVQEFLLVGRAPLQLATQYAHGPVEIYACAFPFFRHESVSYLLCEDASMTVPVMSD